MTTETKPSESTHDQVRWGIIGTGTIADAFVKDLKLTGHLVTAVGSRTKQSGENFAALYDIPRVHASYEALVADDEVDIVYVATPVTRHHADTILALNAGKHVLVEKPFMANAAEAKDVVRLAGERGVLLLEAMWTRWLPHILEIRRLIAEGAIGDVRAIVADHTQKLPEDPGFRLNSLELGGGALLDLGVYPLALASEFLGVPDYVKADSTFSATGVDAETALSLGYPEGRKAVIYTALNALGPNRAAIVGTKGRIEIESVWYTPTAFQLIDNDGVTISEFDQPVEGRGMQFQADEAERLIAAGATQSDILGLDESVVIMETLDSARQQIGLRFPTDPR